MESKMTSSEIMRRIKQGDALIYSYLYQNLGGKVIGYVLKNHGTREDAEDLLQEVFLKLPTAPYKEEGKFISWFFMIVKNLWMQVLRTRKKHDVVTSTDELFYLEDTTEASIEHKIVKERKYEILYQALNELSDDCKKVLQLFEIEGLDSKVIAERYQMNDNAIRTRLKRCRDKWIEKAKNAGSTDLIN